MYTMCAVCGASDETTPIPFINKNKTKSFFLLSFRTKRIHRDPNAFPHTHTCYYNHLAALVHLYIYAAIDIYYGMISKPKHIESIFFHFMPIKISPREFRNE